MGLRIGCLSYWRFPGITLCKFNKVTFRKFNNAGYIFRRNRLFCPAFIVMYLNCLPAMIKPASHNVAD